jgi:plasmid stabilization system protein ParE
MAQVIWSPDALQELEGICAFLEQSSSAFAERFAREVRELALSLPQQPRLGAMVPEYDQEDLRERLLHNYRILYRIRGEDVEVVTVVHGARRLPRTPPG